MSLQEGGLRRDDEADTDDTAALTRDEVFEILSNCRRRYALHHLRTRGAVTLGELAERIAAWENDVAEAAVTSEERKRVYTSLQQVHLPKLGEKAVVEFDDRAGEVRPGPHIKAFDEHLVEHDEHARSWSTAYFGLALMYSIILAGVTGDVSPFTMLPDTYWASIIVTTLALAALAQRYSTLRRGTTAIPERPPELDE